jgi:hypothetical protein
LVEADLMLAATLQETTDRLQGALAERLLT